MHITESRERKEERKCAWLRDSVHDVRRETTVSEENQTPKRKQKPRLCVFIKKRGAKHG